MSTEQMPQTYSEFYSFLRLSMENSIKEIISRTIHSIPPEITNSETELFNSFSASEVVPILQKLFEEETDATIQSRIFDAILKIHNLDKVQFLIDLFNKSSLDWRIACCRHLANFQDSRGITKLCDVVLNDPYPDLRYIAVESLAIIGDHKAIEVLEHAKKNDTGTDYEGFLISDIAIQALQKIYARIHN